MAIEKLQIVGYEAISGVSKKTGNAYKIGSLHTLRALDEPLDPANLVAGQMGATYSVDYEIIMGIRGVKCPFIAEVHLDTVMRFGKMEYKIKSVKPMTAEK